MKRFPRRSGFTFLEVTMAIGIAAILLSAVYASIQMHYQQWEASQQVADEAQVVRALFQKMRSDIQSVVSQWQPPPAISSAAASQATGTSTDSTASTATSAAATAEASTNQTGFPAGGITGESNAVSLIVRTSPFDLDFSNSAPPGTVSSIMRTVTYRLGTSLATSGADAGVSGLIREEVPRMPDGETSLDPATGGRSELLAPEVKDMRIAYYDGLDNLAFWDDTNSGPPECLIIEIAMQVPSGRFASSGNGLRWYQLIVPVIKPSETTQSTDSGAGASTTSAASGSTSEAAGS